MFSLGEGTQHIITIQLSKHGWHGGRVPGKGLEVVVIICPGSSSAAEKPGRRDPDQIPWVTGVAARWQASPELQGGSKGKCKEQADSYSETSPPFKIEYFVIYSNFVLFYCISHFSALQLHSIQYYWHCWNNSRSIGKTRCDSGPTGLKKQALLWNSSKE